jgi:hypothetical protein
MTTRHDAIQRALATATETMHAKGEVQPMIIGQAPGRLLAFPLGDWMETGVGKDIAAGMIGAEMRKSVMPAFMSS